MQEHVERNSLVSLAMAMLAFTAGWGVCVMFSTSADSVAQTQATIIPAEKGGNGESAARQELTGDWPQWGGTSIRNNTPVAKDLPTDWDVGTFDRKSSAQLVRR